MRVLIVGCGYIGSAVGAELARRNHEVFGLRRTSAMGEELEQAGIRPLIGDITRPESLAALPRKYDWVVNTAAASGNGQHAYRAIYLEGMGNLLNWLEPNPPQRLVYTSSTGVYGQDDGSVVTEESVTEPDSDNGRVLLQAERLLSEKARALALPAIIFRVAGIYGPGRGYWLRQFLSGEARLEGTGDRILNMVHRDDVAGAIVWALEKAAPSGVYNLVDDAPSSQRDVFKWLSTALNLAMPPAASASGAARRRTATNKAVSNHKLRSQLGYRFRYPTFRDGYARELENLRGAH